MNRNAAVSFLQRLHGALDHDGGTVRFLAKDHATGQIRRFTAKPGDLPTFSGIGNPSPMHMSTGALYSPDSVACAVTVSDAL